MLKFDKVNSDFLTALGQKSTVIMQPFSFNVKVPANSYTYVDVPITIPEGYKLGTFSVYGGTSRNVVMLSAILSSSDKITVEAISTYTAETTISGNINVLFYK